MFHDNAKRTEQENLLLFTSYVLTTREAVVEVESFPKPDFPNMMNKMEMSDMADFDLDFEPNKVSIV